MNKTILRRYHNFTLWAVFRNLIYSDRLLSKQIKLRCFRVNCIAVWSSESVRKLLLESWVLKDWWWVRREKWSGGGDIYYNHCGWMLTIQQNWIFAVFCLVYTLKIGFGRLPLRETRDCFNLFSKKLTFCTLPCQI